MSSNTCKVHLHKYNLEERKNFVRRDVILVLFVLILVVIVIAENVAGLSFGLMV